MSRSFAAMNSQSASRNMQAPNTEADAWELEIFMVYLDYVFPFLFPFYQPPLVGTSRAWLLSFINQSDAVRHSVISLSSFFFTVGHKEVFRDELQLCRWTLWNEVSNQAKMAFKMMSRDITQVIPSSESPSIIGQAQTMETIIQLLIFDQFVGGSDGWNTHLTMAIDLFLQIFNESSSLNRNTLGLGCVLERMALPDPRVVGFVKTLWNSYQSAFRFFTAVLIYFDIIASTSLGTEPRLRHLHSEILGELPLHEIGSLLNLSYFIGCCNSVMRVIADTAALCSWKKQSEQTGGESPEDIATRAQPLFKALQQFLDSFTSDPSFSESENDDTWRLQPFYRSKSQITSAGLEDNRTSRIWAHAARIYLSVSVNGWNPLATQVEEDASAIILLLENIDSPSDLHTLSWPICLVGCVAAGPVLDPILESIIDKAEQSQLLSSVREAGRVIKTVRSSNVQVRDFAFCFSVLGRPVLLI
ncbi:hypothetical protein N7523_008512 [Penicillium sp. IBT 18751x]|nr:hypothetical protein N7523_008512 [Penicillium sp. IBT 18751x]